MAEFSESLTIRILGDSSQFQQELESVTKQITDLQFRLSQVSDLAVQLGSAFSRLNGMLRPLIQVNRQLGQIEVRIRRINRLPIVINVTQALNALAALLSMLNAVIARMQAISAIPSRVVGAPVSASTGGATGGTGGGAAAPPSGGVRNPIGAGMNSGGLVTGRAGVDRVPAMLSSGEFVMRRSAVQEVGTNLLFSMNRDGLQSLPKEKSSTSRGFNGQGTDSGMSERLFRFLKKRDQNNLSAERTGGAGGSGESTVNHHGDISIQVQQAVDVNSIIRDLRFADYRLRNRRG